MKTKGTLLVVDDNKAVLAAVRMVALTRFERVETITSPNLIPSLLRTLRPDVVLLDCNFTSSANTGGEGLFWLHEIKRMAPDTRVVLFTAYADVALAVKGMKEGAADFVVKPFDNEQLLQTLTQPCKTSPANAAVKDEAPAMNWGNSPCMQELRIMAERVAATDANILITGENGTGKEVLAREIHRLSSRFARPMVAVDMGAVTETLFESELFGHVKGAFTDAIADHPGRFEQAHGGTLFLDEIGNLSYSQQAKLLRALQQRSIMRVGGTVPVGVDIRLVCATNRNLPQMVAEGTFREDLLYRINTIQFHLPSLRERPEDIVPLARMFVQQYARQYGKQGLELTAGQCAMLVRHPWPGNIRQLQHAIEKAVILASSDGILDMSLPTDGLDAVPLPDGHGSGCKERAGTGSMTLEEMERQMIEDAVGRCEGNLSAAAQMLGITRQTLYNKLKRYGI